MMKPDGLVDQGIFQVVKDEQYNVDTNLKPSMFTQHVTNLTVGY